jgi:hypothetical protein
MNDDLLLNNYCNKCKLLNIKCEGFFALKGIIITTCPYFISQNNSTAITDSTKVPYPIKKVVKKSGRNTKNKIK